MVVAEVVEVSGVGDGVEDSAWFCSFPGTRILAHSL